MASPMTDGEENIPKEITELWEFLETANAGVMQSATAGKDKCVISLRAASSIGDIASISTGVPAEAIQRQHAKDRVAEKTPDPGCMQTAKGIARAGGKSIAQDKRTRAPDYKAEEKSRLLVEKLKVKQTDVLYQLGLINFKYDKSWAHHVSGVLGRAVSSCQGQWDSLLKFRNLICEYEKKISSGTNSHVSYWQMDEQQKLTVNEERRISNLEPLPLTFPRDWFELMESIFQIDEVKRNPSLKILGRNLASSSKAHITSSTTDTDVSPRGPLDTIRSQPSSSHDRDSMGPPLPVAISTQAGKQRAGDEVLALLSECILSLLSSFQNQSLPLLQHDRERSLAMEEKKLAMEEKKLAQKRKEFARAERWEEEERMHRGKLLALKVEKLQMKRQKIPHPDAAAYTKPRCDHTNILISCETPANGDVALAHPQPGTYIPFNTIDSTFAPGQQANYIQRADPNKNASFSNDFLVDNPYLLDGISFPVIAREQDSED